MWLPSSHQIYTGPTPGTGTCGTACFPRLFCATCAVVAAQLVRTRPARLSSFTSLSTTSGGFLGSWKLVLGKKNTKQQTCSQRAGGNYAKAEVKSSQGRGVEVTPALYRQIVQAPHYRKRNVLFHGSLIFIHSFIGGAWYFPAEL